MIGKKDTVAIFESYQTYLKEQANPKGVGTEENYPIGLFNRVRDILTKYKNELKASPEEFIKLIHFLDSESTHGGYIGYVSYPHESPEGDASAVNMGEGGVLEVQPDGNYSR